MPMKIGLSLTLMVLMNIGLRVDNLSRNQKYVNHYFK